jgi:hypothetical protein
VRGNGGKRLVVEHDENDSDALSERQLPHGVPHVVRWRRQQNVDRWSATDPCERATLAATPTPS